MLFEKIKKDRMEYMKNWKTIEKEILWFFISIVERKIKDDTNFNKDDNSQVIKLIQKEVKEREESISFLEKANKLEDIKKEKKNVEILKSYLPEVFSEEKTKEIIDWIKKNLNLDNFSWANIWKLFKELAVYGEKIDKWTVNKLIK